jgi:hypothetical protein
VGEAVAAARQSGRGAGVGPGVDPRAGSTVGDALGDGPPLDGATDWAVPPPQPATIKAAISSRSTRDARMAG